MASRMRTAAAQADPTCRASSLSSSIELACGAGRGEQAPPYPARTNTCAEAQSVLEGWGTLALHWVGPSFRLEVTGDIGLD